MASISRTLARIQQDCQQSLPEQSILAACRAVKYRWRERKLGPVATIHLFILQILSFNTAMTHLRHLSGKTVTAAAYCKARMRLPLAVLQQLLRDSAQVMCKEAGGMGRWCSLRTLLVDGSSSLAPDTPSLQKAFPQPKSQKKGCGFAAPKVLGLFDAFTGLIIEMLSLSLYHHEQSQVWRLHPLLKRDDLLVGDRGFCSFVHLAMLATRGVQACFRLHQRQGVDFRPHRKAQHQVAPNKRKGRPTSTFVKRLGKHDQIVRWMKSVRPQWINEAQWAEMPAGLEVRELRYILARRGQRTITVTIGTTLLDPVKYPKEKIGELYGIRWQVETHFAELKTTLKMRKLKSQTADGARKELAVYCLVHNLVHVVMLKAARRQGVTPDRVSFIDTIRWLLTAAPGEEIPDLVINPHRPDRHQPRVVKDSHSTYRKMTRPRKVLKKELKMQTKSLK